MSVWSWLYEYAQNAYLNNDYDRLALAEDYRDALNLMETEPDAAISQFQSLRALAEQLNEPWWMVFYDHWTLQALLFVKRDYTGALKLALKTTVEARQPLYDKLPQRICAHEDLTNAYVAFDPIGNRARIQNALDYMQTEITSDLECRYCLLALRTEFALVCDDLPAAREYAAKYQFAADGSASAHYQAEAGRFLCAMAQQDAKWELLGELAEAGVKSSQATSKVLWSAEFLAWRALAARKRGAPDAEAQRLYRLAVAKTASVSAQPSPFYYDALCTYFEASGELANAWQLRERELYNAIDSGSPHQECEARLKCCRLLAQMGTLTETFVAETRTAAQRLTDPAAFLARLNQIPGVTP